MKLKETWEMAKDIPMQLKVLTACVLVSMIVSVVMLVMMIGTASHAN